MRSSLYWKLLIRFVMQWGLMFVVLWLISYWFNKPELHILGSSFTTASFFTAREFMKQSKLEQIWKYIVCWAWLFISVLIGFLLTPIEFNLFSLLVLSVIIACLGIVAEHIFSRSHRNV